MEAALLQVGSIREACVLLHTDDQGENELWGYVTSEEPLPSDNPLWDALDRESEVRVRVMRRGGRAHHYTYRFE